MRFPWSTLLTYLPSPVRGQLLSEQCLHQPLVLHSDNGAPMKSVTLLSKMYDLGITPSRGRPRVSNDNAYSESLFRTLKYSRSGHTMASAVWMRRGPG